MTWEPPGFPIPGVWYHDAAGDVFCAGLRYVQQEILLDRVLLGLCVVLAVLLLVQAFYDRHGP